MGRDEASRNFRRADEFEFILRSLVARKAAVVRALFLRKPQAENRKLPNRFSCASEKTY
jgi:hypothetical protein